jgi:molybdenum cofactor cytidylyltransferase
MSRTVITDASLSSTVAVIVLAAGTSSRMGASGFHKLLAEFEGVPLIRRSTLVALGCQSQTVVVVTGHRNAEIREAVADLEVQIAYNDQYTSGMASSLGLGVTIAERSQPDGILVMLADMPSLTSSDLDTLIAAFQRNRRKFVVRAVAQGAPGNLSAMLLRPTEEPGRR